MTGLPTPATGDVWGTQLNAYLTERDTTLAPTTVGTRTRPFNWNMNTYGWTTNARAPIRATVGRAFTATTELVDWVVIGDSIMAGYRSVTGVSDPVTIMRNRLKAAGFPVTGGWVFANYGMPSPNVDSHWTRSAGWTQSTGDVDPAPYLYSNTNGASVTFTSEYAGTVLEFAYTAAAAGTFTYSIDSGTAVPVTPPGGTVPIITVTGLANTTHTLTITKTATSTLWVIAARVRQTTGLSLTNASLYGSASEDWLTTTKSSSIINAFNCLTTVIPSPRLAMIGLGGNNAGHTNGSQTYSGTEHTPAALNSDITAIVTNLQGRGAAVGLQTYMATDDAVIAAAHTSNQTWAPWVSALYDVSDSMDIPVLEHSASVPTSFTTLRSQGLMYASDTHMLAPGSSVMALREVNMLTGA